MLKVMKLELINKWLFYVVEKIKEKIMMDGGLAKLRKDILFADISSENKVLNDFYD